jgi:nucleoside-diphosphate-sugar epimerase
MTEHESEELETEVEDGGEIITLFGIDGPVGKHFVKLALSAGYHIRALSPTPIDLEHEYLTVVKGDLNVEESILEDLLRHSTYVVCLLSDSTPKKDYPEGLLFNFIQRIYPLVKESTVRVFLYQVSKRTSCQHHSQPNSNRAPCSQLCCCVQS